MEKPWMPSLVNMLQTPSKEPAPEERAPEASDSEEPTSQRLGTDRLWSANPTGRTDNETAGTTREAAFERPGTSAPPSDNFSFSGGTNSRWARATKEPDGVEAEWSPGAKAPLEYEGSTYWSESWSDRVIAHAPAITVVVLLLVALGALSFFYRVQVGQSLVRFGEKISGELPQNPAAPAPTVNASAGQPAPPVIPQPEAQTAPAEQAVSSPDASSADGPSPGSTAEASVPATSLAKNSDAARGGSSKQSAALQSPDHVEQQSHTKALSPAAPEAADNGQSDFQLAEASLHEARTPAEKARAAGLLWTAVSNGSSDAEVALADVYGRGEGVRKNCQQARILLAAARDKNNPLAGKEAAELRVYGCR